MESLGMSALYLNLLNMLSSLHKMWGLTKTISQSAYLADLQLAGRIIINTASRGHMCL